MLNTQPSPNWRDNLVHRLSGLPRDTRDTLLLLALIGWVVLMQAEHLPLWCTALTGAVLAWRGTHAW